MSIYGAAGRMRDSNYPKPNVSRLPNDRRPSLPDPRRSRRLIRARKLSPLEYTETLIKRIETFEPQLNAFITRTFELARTHARAAEADIAAGNYRGPLHGIPSALKDIYNTKGILTSGGSKVCKDNVPSADATTTRRLLDAGMVLLGELGDA